MKCWAMGVLSLSALLAAGISAAAELAGLIQGGERRLALQTIGNGADVNVAQADGTTPLHWAVYRVDVDLVEALLASGADPSATNRFGATPVGEAVKIGHVELVAMLLEAGAEVEAANEDGQTALMLAARGGQLEIAQLLVGRGADVNAREAWRGQTVLMWAAANDHAEIAELLIAQGADVDARASFVDWPRQMTSEPRTQYRPTGGLTVLLYAVRSGCFRCVAAMVEAGADINQPNPDGITPLINAIDNLHFDVARYLLEHGANPHIWDWWGRTPLYVAVNARPLAGQAEEGELSAMDMVALLLDAGVTPNPQLHMHRPGRGANNGRFGDPLLTAGATPLLRAALLFDVEAIAALLAAGAQVDLPNVTGVTPLMAAAGLGGGGSGADAQARAVAVLDILLAAGADVNARVIDTNGRTARHGRGSAMSDREGQTALYGAAGRGWSEVVEYLIDRGAEIEIVDDFGRSPVDAAMGDGGGRGGSVHEDVAELLRSHSDALPRQAGASQH